MADAATTNKPGSAAGVTSSASTKKPEKLYEARKQIYPKLAHGKFRVFKWFMLFATLGVYYGLPWLRWDRGPDLPNQAVLADFANERFYFFMIEIWPQEVYYITGLLILASLALFLVTSMFGRVWCGYSCPQTIWTDLFITVERFFEGDRAARMRLSKAPLTTGKLLRKTGKHIVWLVISLVTGGALVFYFHDAPTAFVNFFTGKAAISVYVFAGVMTFMTYILAGFMREQVCIYMCPWPRIQGALTDEYALNVTYRYDRGEPRGPHRKRDTWEGRGDCIDCDQCVQVCPMGIDIRDGAQLECIHCALCIDACDTMMKRVGRPTGLIAYDTDLAVEQRAAGKTPKYKFLRARTILYAILSVAVAGLMTYGLATRSTFGVDVLKDRSPPFIRLSDGSIRNGYALKIVNKDASPREMIVTIEGIEGLTLSIIGQEDTGGNTVTVPVGSSGVDRFRMLIVTPPGEAFHNRTITVTISDEESGETHVNKVPFSGSGPK